VTEDGVFPDRPTPLRPGEDVLACDPIWRLGGSDEEVAKHPAVSLDRAAASGTTLLLREERV
jgi:hypothetical protein